MSDMFSDIRFYSGGTTSFNQDISGWDVSNVTSMSGMFFLATSFNQDIGDWDVSNVTNMHRMFGGGGSFSQMTGCWPSCSYDDNLSKHLIKI